MKIRETLKRYKSNRIVYIAWYTALGLICFLQRAVFFVKSHWLYLFSRQSAQIKSFQNKYAGERCFIVATGPSLTYEDLELLKDEYTFSMNSLVLGFEHTQWRPSFYGIQDENVYEKVEHALLESNLQHVFVSNHIAAKYNVPSSWTVFQLDYLNQRMETSLHNHYYTKFSENFALKAYNGYTITYTLIQLAYYMGFKEIYLLGCDCNYVKGEKQHFIEHGHHDPTFETAKDRMFAAYKEAKVFGDSHNLKIYNATRGGVLEIFPRVCLEEVLK